MVLLKLLWLLILTLVFHGCSSAPTNKGFEKDEVLSTLNDRSTPDWAVDGEASPVIQKNGKFYSVGITTLRGDERTEAGIRVAEANARANLAKMIGNRLEVIFQNAEENASLDGTTFKYINSEMSQLTTHSMAVEGAFWKRYAQTQEDGSRRILYKLYSLVSISEPDMKKAVLEAISGVAQTHKISETFQAQVNKQWDRFVDGDSNTQVAKQ